MQLIKRVSCNKLQLGAALRIALDRIGTERKGLHMNLFWYLSPVSGLRSPTRLRSAGSERKGIPAFRISTHTERRNNTGLYTPRSSN